MHCVRTSRAPIVGSPSFSWTNTPPPGKNQSGETVAKTMKSIFSGAIPERAMATLAASVPRSAVPVPGSTNLRSRTPVR